MPERIDEPPPRIEPAPTAVPAFAGRVPDGPGRAGRDPLGRASTGRPSATRTPGSPARSATGSTATGAGDRPRARRAGLERPATDFTLLSLPPDAPDGDVPDGPLGRGVPRCAPRDARSSSSTRRPARPPARSATGPSALGLGEHAAAYFPRLEGGRGPSGAVAATIARVDARRGVWRAPAGLDARSGDTGRRPRRCGDRAADAGQRPAHRPAGRPGPVGRPHARRRRRVAVRQRAPAGHASSSTRWTAGRSGRCSSPTTSRCGRACARRDRGASSADLFRAGAFAGRTPADAYVVRAGRDTTTEDDLRAGRVNVEIGFAPLRPAEFVCVRIGVWTASRASALSSAGATCFLRLITPGRAATPSSQRVAVGALQHRALAGRVELRRLAHDVGDHQRDERRPLALADRVERLQQLVAALRQRLPDRLDLRDAQPLAAAGVVVLDVARDDVLRRHAREVGRALEHLAPERGGVDRQHLLEVGDDRAVALGRGRRVEDHGVGDDRAEQQRRRRGGSAPCRSGGSAR